MIGFCWAIPTAFSEDTPIDHGSIGHGSMDNIDHSEPSVSGEEYRTEQPDAMDHRHMDHGESDGSIFRTKGAHDDMGMSKPGDMSNKALFCLLYTSPSPRDRTRSRMPSSA